MAREWVILGLDSDKIQKHSKRRREKWAKYDATPERKAQQAKYYQENKEQILEKKKLRVRTPEFKLRNTTWKKKKYREFSPLRGNLTLALFCCVQIVGIF